MFSIGVAAGLLGMCVKTLRRWDKGGKIFCAKTVGRHMRFSIREIERILKGDEAEPAKPQVYGVNPDKCAIYGRVSSHKQSKEAT